MSIPDVYRALWRHKALIVAGVFAAALASWYLTSRQAPVYEAASLVRIQQKIDSPTEAFAALQTGQRLAQTYARITRTETIAREVERRLDGKVPYGQIQLGARQVDDLELLLISARHSDPEKARLVATTAPDAVRAFIQETGTLNEQVITVQPATLPKTPVGPAMKLNIALAFLLGVILSCALALLLDAIADRAADPEEIEDLTGKPVLATIPVLGFSSGRKRAEHEVRAP